MDRILVATDFSTRSDRALQRATLIAGRGGAALTLLHVVDGDRPSRLIASEEAAARSLLEEIARTVRETDGVEAEALVTVDDVDTGIIDAAEEVAAQLLVVGPHRPRFRDVFVGTKVDRVIRRARLPTLVATRVPSAPYGRTLLALDFDDASKSAARAALDLGVFDHTDVIAFHAFDAVGKGMMQRGMVSSEAIDEHVETERALAARQMRSFVGELGLPTMGQRVSESSGSPVRSIVDGTSSTGADLIVMGTNQRKGFERMLIGSVAEDVIHHSDHDILIVPVDEG